MAVGAVRSSWMLAEIESRRLWQLQNAAWYRCSWFLVTQGLQWYCQCVCSKRKTNLGKVLNNTKCSPLLIHNRCVPNIKKYTIGPPRSWTKWSLVYFIKNPVEYPAVIWEEAVLTEVMIQCSGEAVQYSPLSPLNTGTIPTSLIRQPTIPGCQKSTSERTNAPELADLEK